MLSKIITAPDLQYVPDPRGLGYVFYQCMRKHPDKIAQIDGVSGQTDTYGHLLKRCVSVARALRKRGLSGDDVVTTCSLNHLDACVPYFASLMVGIKPCGIDPHLSLEDMIHLLVQVSPKVIFVEQCSVNKIELYVETMSAKCEIIVFDENFTVHTMFSDLLLSSSDVEEFRPYEAIDENETALIIFSSGTTGLPKGICINHRHFLSQLFNTINCGFCFTINMMCTSLFWISAILFLSISVFSGNTRVILPKFHAVNALRALEKYKVTFFAAAPNQMMEMCSLEKPNNLALKHLTIGGTPLLEKQVMHIRKYWEPAKLFPGYGQTEIAMRALIFHPSKPEDEGYMVRKPNSCGTIMRGFSYKVVDLDTGEPLGPNRTGELRLKTKLLMNGYWKQDSSYVWAEDGWYKTGDVAYYDEEGCFYVVERLKELLKFRNMHVAPAFIESILLRHPAVSRCVVVGIPHDMYGDLPAAVVVLHPEYTNIITSSDIIKFTDENLEDRKRLRGGVTLVENLPVEPTGKVKRRLVRNMLLRGEFGR